MTRSKRDLRRNSNFTRCTKACPAGEHKHYAEGNSVRIRYTLQPTGPCHDFGNHWHRTETVPAATLLERWFPTRRVGRLG